MIALPKWAESAINATPEKVAAFSGVWPISSVRNVMVRKYRKVEKRLCLCGQRLKPGYGICCRCIKETAKTPTQREIRKEMTRRKNGRPCKKCGVEFSSRDRSYCSAECRKAAAVPITYTKCGTCGKDVAKKNHLGSSILFCGGRCQRVYASSCQPSWKDWIAASGKARQKWYRARSRERYMRSFHRKLSLLASADYTPKKKTWRDKFNSIAQCNKHREELSVIRAPVVNQRKQGKWQRSDVAAWQCRFRSLSVIRKAKGLVTWKEKLNNIAGNQRRRMKTKSLRQRLRNLKTSRAEDVITAVSN